MSAKLLSKSRLLSARQCKKRLWLEVHRPELAVVPPAALSAMRAGERVGAAARVLYTRSYGEGRLVSYERGSPAAIAETRGLMAAECRGPIFEATFEHDELLIRADVLLPDAGGWRLVEVKAATERQTWHDFDCAIQAFVLKGAGVPLRGVSLAHVDKRFVYRGEGDYDGLLVREDLFAESERLLPAVAKHAASSRETAAAGAEPDVAVGRHCFHPRECPFTAYCWPSSSDYPVQNLGGSKARLAEFVAEGLTDLRDVPPERLTARQRRIQRASRAGRAELAPAAADEIAGLSYPRYYLDFETVAPPLPLWPGTRPYEALPFQWSCHYEAAPGALAHADYLDLSGAPPMRRLAESLIRVLGRDGPILAYTMYEKTVLARLAEQAPDLAPALFAIVARLVDLKVIVERHYYHPAMRGSWSLKAVLPTVSTELSYQELQGIQDGMEASEGYFEAIDPAVPDARRRELAAQLRRYCRADTEAMVHLTRFLAQGG